MLTHMDWKLLFRGEKSKNNFASQFKVMSRKKNGKNELLALVWNLEQFKIVFRSGKEGALKTHHESLESLVKCNRDIKNIVPDYTVG